MKNKKLSLFFTYIFCIVLISIYFVILFLPPNVCLEYKMYYIDKTLTEWPGYGGLHCEFGQKVLMSKQGNKKDCHAGVGWGNREDAFRWSVGNTSKLYFTTEYQGEMLIVFEIGELLCSKFNVFINDELVGTSDNINGRFLLCEFSGKRIINEKENLFEVRFEIFDTVKPNEISTSNDDRALGFQLYSFTLLPDNEFCNKFYDVYDLINSGLINFELGNSVYLGEELSNIYCLNGWGGREHNFRWTDGESAFCCFQFVDEVPKKIILQIGNKLCNKYNILINDNMLVENCEIENNTLTLDISENVIYNSVAKVEIQLKNPQRPCDISDSDDTRLLGIQVLSMAFQ